MRLPLSAAGCARAAPHVLHVRRAMLRVTTTETVDSNSRCYREHEGRMSMGITTFLGGKPIKRMGFGAMQLSGPGVFGPPSDIDEARAVLRRAVELGVDHIDTAQYYGPGVVNDLIREALYPYPENLKLVTKVGARRDPAGGIFPAQRPEELREGVEENLRSLRVERLALVNLRLVGDGGGPSVPLV